ncbi:hypothetical protein EON66_00770 [archaeon]|nr:MAG: hypothetical protein EON66_00770 [archaeon]
MDHAAFELRCWGGCCPAHSGTRCSHPATPLSRQHVDTSHGVQILTASRSLPHALYASFVSELVHTARDDIADCAAASYPSLSLAAAQKMMLFDSQAELVSYLKEAKVWRTCCCSHDTHAPQLRLVCDAVCVRCVHAWHHVCVARAVQPDWTITGEHIQFKTSGKSGVPDINATVLLERTLGYAIEMERIV